MSRRADPEPGAPADEVAVVATQTGGAAAADLILPGRRRRRAWTSLAAYVVMVFVLVTLNFAIPRMMPGDPIDALMASGNPTLVARPGLREDLERYYGLDESLPEQYVHYLQRLARGDFGVSTNSTIPVGDELWGRVGWSFLLIGTATAVSIAIGIPLGIHSGWRRGKRLDRGLLALFLAWQNLPVFIVGSVSFVLLAGQAGVFPLVGSVTPFSEADGLAHLADIAHHLALPALLLGLDLAAFEYLIMRSSMVTELGSDHLLLGRAKGLRERRLKYGYAGRNALLPVVTVIGLQVGVAITTTVFVESIFGYPGVGLYMLGGIGNRDYPVLQGAFLVLTVTVVTVNLVVDLLYRRLDPRTAT